MNREAANTIKGRLVIIEESLKNVETNVFCLKNFAEILEPDQARQMFLNMEHDLINAWQTVNDQLNEPESEYHETYNLNTEVEPIEIPPLPVDDDETFW